MKKVCKSIKKVIIIFIIWIILLGLQLRPNPSYSLSFPKDFNFEGKLAFTANIQGNWELFIVTSNSKEPVRLTHTPHDERCPSWSPDGQKITYSLSDDQIARIDINTKKVTYFPQLEGRNIQPDNAPSEDKIIYVHLNPEIRDETDLYIFSMGERNVKRFLRQPSAQYYPRWSPDGRQIVYINFHCSADCGRAIQELWMAKADGYNAWQLLMTNSMCMSPAWSPDGEKIAFSSDMKGNFDIWIFEYRKNGLIQVTKDANLDSHPCWSPDGQNLAFISNRTGKMMIWIKDLKTERLFPFYPFGDKSISCKDLDWE